MKKFILFLLPVVFLIVNLFTLSDYNVNWDEPVHFFRGQAYLNYFLTGKVHYDNLLNLRRYREALVDKTKHFDNTIRYSIYQSDNLDASYFLSQDSGHPPLNGILAATTNRIFYQKLGILGDVESYHLFILLVTTVLIFLIMYWSVERFGGFAGVVSFMTIALYPMFIVESHNNIKDPVEATFFAIAIYFFYKAVSANSWKFMLSSAVLAGMAISTKLNVVFAPVIIIPWLIVLFLTRYKGKKFTFVFSGPMIVSFILYPLIVGGIFYASWPYLWANPVGRTLEILNYYRQIGTGGSQPGYHFFGLNTYPTLWVLFTTPVLTLLLTLSGVIGAVLVLAKERYKTSILWLIWFIMPIARVSLPGASIYGGDRQIIEFLPAMALLAGGGAKFLLGIVAKKYRNSVLFFQIVLLLFFVPVLIKIIILHPNENLFFNTLIGGLQGASERNLPGWGTTLGNPYLQGVKWINQYAQKDAKVALDMGVMTNIPFNAFRQDITYLNNLKSVQWRKGEYVIGLTYSEFPIPFYDAMYYHRFLNPIHQISVDGVPIVLIWKNDPAYVKQGFLHEKEVALTPEIKVNGQQVELSLSSSVYLTRLQYSYAPVNCQHDEDAIILTSLNGKDWKREPETLLSDQIPEMKKNINEGKITHFIAAVPAKFIRITAIQEKSCLLRQPGLRLFALQDIAP